MDIQTLDCQKKLNKYVNSYGLWQKSETIEISLTNIVVSPGFENVAPTPKGVEVIRDSCNRKLVKRDGLYSSQQEIKEHKQGYFSAHNWMQKNCQVTSTKSQQKQKGKTNKIQRNLTKALAQPVEISKGATMLQKMGWQGGALGKSGTGIVVPIAPDASYAATTKGLGHTNVKVKSEKIPKKAKAKAKVYEKLPVGDKQAFKFNILNLILDFVKDDNDIELAFEDTLMSRERLVIHNIVNSVINVDEADIEDWWCNDDQMEIVRRIQERSCFVLGTKSYGANPKRQLTIYKESPPNVYVVIPDDLKDEGCDKTGGDKTTDAQIANDIGEDDTTNGDTDTTLTENATRNDDSYLLDQIIGYFEEFIDQAQYTDFRFLGPFEAAERTAISEFFTVLNVCTNSQGSGHHHLLDVIKGKHLEIYGDCNGTTVIHKVTECEGDTDT